MKESISYTFILNIVIVFVVSCGAILAGIFSYYRAFKANKIIVSELEKYEGFNCVSKEAIEKKISGIYSVPFEAECKSKYGNPCQTGDGYVVVAYNLDYSLRIPTGTPDSNSMSAHVGSDGYTHKYQFGVYTYMYIDLPLFSNLFKMTVHTKTRELYEFRNLATADLYVQTTSGTVHGGRGVIDLNMIPLDIRKDPSISQDQYTMVFSDRILSNYVSRDVAHRDDYEYGYSPAMYGYGLAIDEDRFNAREAFRYGELSLTASQYYMGHGEFQCGHVTDWSLF